MIVSIAVSRTFLFLGIILSSHMTSSYEILGVCTAAFKSHWSSCESVFRALSSANHNVTVISMLDSNYEPRPNHHIVHLDGLLPAYLSLFPEHFSDIESGFETVNIIFHVGINTFDLMMGHEKMQKFLQEDRHFDLVIVESFATEGFYGLGEHFKAPLIGLSTTVATGWLNMAVGNYEPWSSVPNQFLFVQPEMTFNDRLNNVLLNTYEYLRVTRHLIPTNAKLMKRHLPGNKKSLQQVITEDVCLGFVNDHFTLSLPRSKSPNMIEIGGIHLKQNTQELTGEFKEFVDSADKGVIVFSLGSILSASELPKRDLEAIIKVFSKLKQKIVWRYDLTDADKLPNNILARPWIPQGQLLAHKNTKLFISHGGMLGTTEAVANGVPMLGIPFFGDQHVNIARAVYRGYAKSLDRYSITEHNLNVLLQDLLTDLKYAENAKFYSEAFLDKPMSPQETVVYWSEYVIKHKCAGYMKVMGSKMGVIESHNLDVWTVIMLMAVVILATIILLVRVVFAALSHFNDKIKRD